MTPCVKICGVTRPEDAAFAAGLGVWAIGMVFVPSSPRCIDVECARAIAAALPDSVVTVGVFAGQPQDEISDVCRQVRLELIQLHGAENLDEYPQLSADRIIRAVFIDDEPPGLAPSTGYVLIDRRDRSSPPIGEDAAARLAKKHPRTIVAGGLNDRTVACVVAAAAPWGVDVSSGVESAPGIKDPTLVRRFVDAVRIGAGEGRRG